MERLIDVGYCQQCKTRSPLTKEQLCPICLDYPLVVTYQDACGMEEEDHEFLEENYMPVSGWNRRWQPVLYAYINPMRTVEGWKILQESSRKDIVSNLRIGMPMDIIRRGSTEDELAEAEESD